MKHGVVLVLSWMLAAVSMAQQPITLDQIWKTYQFYGRTVANFQSNPDGKTYAVSIGNAMVTYDYANGKELGRATFTVNGKAIDFESVTYSENRKKALIVVESSPIYRYSSEDMVLVWDEATQQATLLSDKPVKYATFSPNGSKVAYVQDNNLYYADLSTGKTVQVTTDGAVNEVINGGSDWVYEEEFTLVKAFEWSPDGAYLAYLKFDERAVPQFEMAVYQQQLYPQNYVFKYPKVGEKNSVVTAHVYDVAQKVSKAILLGKSYEYIPRLGWTATPGLLYLTTMNRLQNNLQLWTVDAAKLTSKILLEETSDTYIEINDDVRFLADGKSFLWRSEQDGFSHLYQYGMDGKKIRQLTQGNWEVTQFYGIHEKTGTLYYQSTEVSPLERQVYAVSLDGKKKTRLTAEGGTHEASFSATFDYFMDTYSDAGVPYVVTIRDKSGKILRTLEENKPVVDRLAAAGVAKPEFFTFKNRAGDDLNGWMIKPAQMPSGKKVPVLMFVYGGPGSQEVLRAWDGGNYAWFQMLAQKGYIVACVDNRGTGGRGRAFRTTTYEQLGKLETEDQIDGAKYLGSLPYVDASRIGIFGWSYGGYMSSLCILKGADVFKAAIAVAPVTNWKFYDNIYTERYMGTLETNPKGFDANAPIGYASQLKGSYLLVHGTADDNVHWQNTAELTEALVQANKQFDQFIYPDKNHGIYGGLTRLHLFTKMTLFLEKNL